MKPQACKLISDLLDSALETLGEKSRDFTDALSNTDGFYLVQSNEEDEMIDYHDTAVSAFESALELQLKAFNENKRVYSFGASNGSNAYAFYAIAESDQELYRIVERTLVRIEREQARASEAAPN